MNVGRILKITILWALIVFLFGCGKIWLSVTYYNQQIEVNEQLTVQPVYPNNGVNWNSYVKNDGADIFSASDTACAGTETGYAGCLHGGQMRKVVLSGISSCSGLSMTDSLDVFVWYCVVKNGTATFYSVDFQTGSGLQNLVNAAAWNNNSVVLTGANGNYIYSGTSSSSVWGWTNPITPLPDNHLGIDSPVALGVAGTIYVLATSRGSQGYSTTANQIAIVTLPGVTMNYGGNNSSWCTGGGANAILCPAGNFIWIEGIYDANAGGGTNASATIETNYVSSMTFSRFHLITAKNSTANGISAFETTNCTFDQIKTSNNAIYGFSLQSSTNNFIKKIVSDSNVSDGVNLGDSFGPLPTGNVFYQINSLNNGNDGFNVSGATSNFIVQLVDSNNANEGLEFANGTLTGDTFSEITTNNNSFEGIYVGFSGGPTNFNTFNNVVAVNNGGDGLGPSVSEANNTFSQIVATNNVNGISATGTNDNFLGFLVVGNNSTNNCANGGGTSGLINTTCTNTGTDGNNSYAGQTSTAVLRINRNLGSSFFGKVTTTDPANSSNVNGTASYPGTPDTFDFGDFSNLFRGWGLDNGGFPGSDQGQWTSGPGEIWDWRLLASDTQVLNTSGNGATSNGTFVPYGNCPAASYGSEYVTDQSARTYLLNAMEIVDPFTPGYSNTGNHNGLCESGEACIYTPNFGAYQGEGNLEPCTFVQNGGSVSGVTMYGYITNGAP